MKLVEVGKGGSSEGPNWITAVRHEKDGAYFDFQLIQSLGLKVILVNIHKKQPKEGEVQNHLYIEVAMSRFNLETVVKFLEEMSPAEPEMKKRDPPLH